ncbi:hypothetical protein LTR84_008039 [Exophiala bonariae]|uniref:GDP/GTP exchange factor Sec2 N-terminal domain-containing protein n=1 Tax=Exophiala bonariae TaxID=1690606 RepID=A0AAV9NM61_9EURO|nr:hypothetical protein LTR84_008039 [Exophiala bonariae]
MAAFMSQSANTSTTTPLNPGYFPMIVSQDSPLSLPPPASTPTRYTHQRSRTATTLPPLFTRSQSSSPTRSSALPQFLRPQSTRSISPERVSVSEAAQFEVARTPPEEQTAKKRNSSAVDKLASWFEGSSEPVNISLIPSPTKEKLDPVAEVGVMESLFSTSQESVDTFTRRPQRDSISSTPATPAPSRFNFFRKSTTVSPTSPNLAEEDELSQLDVREALFPQGYPDNFSPSTFKNLQLNAEGVVRRFQQAHIEQQKSVKALTSTKTSQADELEAANTRNEHLKFQLEDMAQRALEQEKAIAELRAQLASQRASLDTQLSQNQQSVRMVSNDDDAIRDQDQDSTLQSKYRRHRISDISSSSAESEIASDASSVVSVFSEAMSTATSMKSASSSHTGHDAAYGCSKCHGLHANEAWDVVGMMKLESAGLKSRISQLESAQDEALDFLSGLKLD